MNRWAPKGKGWIRTFDFGDVAVWMRPNEDGVEIAVYAGCAWGAYDDPQIAEAWHVQCFPGSWLPFNVMDKPHRVRWVMSVTSEEHVLISRTVLRASHKGHRRLNHNRYIHKWPLPRKILRALGEV